MTKWTLANPGKTCPCKSWQSGLLQIVAKVALARLARMELGKTVSQNGHGFVIQFRTSRALECVTFAIASATSMRTEPQSCKDYRIQERATSAKSIVLPIFVLHPVQYPRLCCSSSLRVWSHSNASLHPLPSLLLRTQPGAGKQRKHTRNTHVTFHIQSCPPKCNLHNHQRSTLATHENYLN